jgi:hypothetical protein
MQITVEMAAQAYVVGVRVNDGQLTTSEAKNELVSATGMNETSAANLVDDIVHMLRGEVYKRTMNFESTKLILHLIRADFGLAQFKDALFSLDAHLDYYDTLEKGGHPSLRELHRASLQSAQAEEELVVSTGTIEPAPIANDFGTPASRMTVELSRIIRDTALSRRVKKLYNHDCQICGQTIHLPNGLRYAEGHHVRPLGQKHNGPDLGENILCLCPNCHAMCDFGAIRLDIGAIRTREPHRLAAEYIDYHNQHIFRP